MENPQKLPIELSNNIFNNQIELETQTITQQLLTQTIQLYAKAVEFYESIISDNVERQDFDEKVYQKRSCYYQEKIRKLMTRNDVEQCLVGKDMPQKCSDFKKQLSLAQQRAPQQIRSIIDSLDTKVEQKEKLVKETLNIQKMNLKGRIQHRSKSRYKKYEDNAILGSPNLPELKQTFVNLIF